MFKVIAKTVFTAFLILGASSAALSKTVALALSGGGARGFAHIGILKALEEERLEPDLIIGTSMGAVVGALYAAGYSTTEMRELALRTDWSSLFLDRPARRNLFLAKKETSARHILSLRFRGWEPEVPLALSSGQKVWEKLHELCARAPYQPLPSFDDLRIPFRAVATDLVTGKPVIFSRGDLAEALRASVSLPLVLTPFQLDTLSLVDGGVIENIPVDLARSLGADVVIAVDLSTGFVSGVESEMPWDLADRVTTIMHIERNERSRATADLVITPNVGRHRSSDFSNLEMLMDSGYHAARAQLMELRNLLHDSATAISSARGPAFCSRTTAVRFRSDPGSFGPVRAYRFHGTSHIPDTTLWRLPVGTDGFGKLGALREEYVRGGHTLAHAFELRLDSSGTLHSWWDEGRIRSIEVTGLRRYSPHTLLREFPLDSGELWDVRRARRGIAQIYGSDLFESVTLSALPSDSGVSLTLRARERESPQLRLGAGFSLERRGRGFAEFLNDNMLDFGARLELFGKYGERDEELRGRVIFDRFPFNTPFDRWSQSYLTVQLGMGWLREEYNFYSSAHRDTAFYFFERERGELYLGRAFRRWGEVKGGVRYEGVRAGGVYDEPTSHATYFGLRTLIDTKDTYPFPNSGVVWDGQYEYALKSRQTGRAFNRVRLMTEGYLPWQQRLVAHARGDWAWNDRILPLWAQFPLGGEQSLLGLHTAERYGSARLMALAELRYDLISQWLADAYVSALYTVGAVSDKSNPLPASRDYQHGFGVSLGLSTLLGPINFTVGELLASHFSPRHTRFYLNLGHEF